MDAAEITKQLLLQIIEGLHRENEKLKNENIILKKCLKDG